MARAELDDALAEVVVAVVVVVVVATVVADVLFAVEDVFVSIVGSACSHFLVGRLSAHAC